MKIKKATLYFLLGFISIQFCSAQNLDSLWNIYNNKNQVDTNRVKALNDIAFSYFRNNPDTAILLAEQQIQFANSLPIEKGRIWIAYANNTIGEAYTNKGNYSKALDHCLKALQTFEEIANKKGLGTCYNAIGTIYYIQLNYSKTLQYNLKALQLFEEIGYKQGIGNCYRKIGNVYFRQSNFPKALEFQFKSLKIKQEFKDKEGIAGAYTNIGSVYAEQSDLSTAIEYNFKALQIWKELDDIRGKGRCFDNIAELFNNLSNYKLTILYCDSALQMSKIIGDVENEREIYRNLSTAYSKSKRYKEAYENHVKFKQLTDDLFNGDNSKRLNEIANNFESEKRELQQSKLDAIALEEKQKQRIIIYSVIGFLLIVVVFSALLYKRFRLTINQKKIIEIKSKETEEQKLLIEEKQKEVMDSIRYASRIQRALITSEKYIANQLNRLMKN